MKRASNTKNATDSTTLKRETNTHQRVERRSASRLSVTVTALLTVQPQRHDNPIDRDDSEAKPNDGHERTARARFAASVLADRSHSEPANAPAANMESNSAAPPSGTR